MKLTPSQVKNYMRRGLRRLVDPDPEPADRQRCIQFFDNSCAYCGESIKHGDGDLDHLVSAALGGRNHISNRVYSCKACNAEEKREKQWEEFLAEKQRTEAAFCARRQRIMKWIAVAGEVAPLSKAVMRVLEDETARVTAEYDEACKRVRECDSR